jgi:hypothetical protein
MQSSFEVLARHYAAARVVSVPRTSAAIETEFRRFLWSRIMSVIINASGSSVASAPKRSAKGKIRVNLI